MLKTVKTTITNLPCISFRDYFQKYVLDIQDMEIDLEFEFLSSQNNLEVLSLAKLISRDSMLGETNDKF